MERISALFINGCMVLIAGSVGVVVYLRLGFAGAEATLVALLVLATLAGFNKVAARKRGRGETLEIAELARGCGELARQLAEFGRRLGAIESKAEMALEKSLSTAQPLAAEIEEMSRLVKELADSVARHDSALDRGVFAGAAAAPVAAANPPPPKAASVAVPAVDPVSPIAVMSERQIAAFDGLDRKAIIALVGNAIDTNKIDLYLQPIVTLPQRKVRYYEAMSRLKTGSGGIVPAADFLPYADAGLLLPKLDNLSVLRCVQVVRRLLLKNRDIGLFCNVSGATLTDPGFPQLLEFLDANRAIAPSLIFEFTQRAFRAMGPIEHESLAALAQRGFGFSLDNLSDFRVEPRELTDRGFRFVKASATLLLNRAGAASTDIHPADLSDLLGRFGIDLVAERIESETAVVDLLDYDVRFGQGYLFSPPRPVRAEALQSIIGDVTKDGSGKDHATAGDAGQRGAGLAGPSGDRLPAARGNGLGQFARAASGRN